MVKKVFYAFILWRVLLFISLFVSESFLRVREGFDYTTPLHYMANSPITAFLLYPWANFDGVYYLIIAGGGYTVDNSGFFPLFPILIRIFSLNSIAFSLQQFLAALVLSSILSFVGLVFFEKLIIKKIFHFKLFYFYFFFRRLFSLQPFIRKVCFYCLYFYLFILHVRKNGSFPQFSQCYLRQQDL